MTVLSRPMFNRGGMVHDERTIRNVDDEIYRIAPKTHSRGRERMDAREEYGRLLREKDYLRNEMNRMAKGGGVASFPDLSGDGKVTRKDILMGRGVIKKANGGGVMDMLPAPVAGELAAMEQQGMALGADMAMQQEAAIDSAEDPKQLIDAMRGNQLPLQERYNELATFVGPNDAAITPTSVLALTQPAIIMASEGAVDQGIGNLIEGMTGDVMMDDAMGAAPMGMGVGELMAGSPPPPVPMNTGGAVKKLQLGGDPSFDLGTQTQRTVSELQDLVGLTDEEQALQQAAIYANLADRAFAFAGNRDPRTGEALEGNLLEKAAQAGQGVMSDIVKARAPLAANQRQIRNIALQDALARRTMQEKAGYDLGAAIASAQLGGPSKSQLLGFVSDPAMVEAYANHDPKMTPELVNFFELGLDQVTTRRPITRIDPKTQETFIDYVEDPLPPFLADAVARRKGTGPEDSTTPPVSEPGINPTTGLPTSLQGFLDMLEPRTEANQLNVSPVNPVNPNSERDISLDTVEVTGQNPDNPEQTITSSASDYFNETLTNVSEKFGLQSAVVGLFDDFMGLISQGTAEGRERDLLEANLRGLNSQLLAAFLASPGVNVRGQYAWNEFRDRLPTVEGITMTDTRVLGAYKDVLESMSQEVASEIRKQQLPLYQQDPTEMQKSVSAVFAMGYEIKKLEKLIETLEAQTGRSSSPVVNEALLESLSGGKTINDLRLDNG
jgi:hypothetical protein